MATTARKTTAKTSTTAKKKESVKDTVIEDVVKVDEVESIVAEEPKVKETVKEYKATDAIPCESITSGELGMIGIKSNINYRWAERNDVTDVEYQDLVAAIRSGSVYITKPYFLIRDNDFLAQFPQVVKAYESLYTIHDLKDVVRMDKDKMVATIMELPEGAKQSIKNIAATMIQNGSLDSVIKIKALDEIFDTKMMLMTDLYD